jgi:hypothetical protein
MNEFICYIEPATPTDSQETFHFAQADTPGEALCKEKTDSWKVVEYPGVRGDSTGPWLCGGCANAREALMRAERS